MSSGYYGSIAGEAADRAARYNVPVRTCAWCETAHPENIRVPWFPVEIYFCSDACLREFSEAT